MSTAETNLQKNKYTTQSDRQLNDDSSQPLPRKRKKVVKKTSKSEKIRIIHADGTSSNRVTSTTSPILAGQGKPW